MQNWPFVRAVRALRYPFESVTNEVDNQAALVWVRVFTARTAGSITNHPYGARILSGAVCRGMRKARKPPV